MARRGRASPRNSRRPSAVRRTPPPPRRARRLIVRELKLLEKHLPKTGRYKDVTWDIQWKSFTSGPPLTNEMVAGKLDVGSMADFPAVLNATNAAIDRLRASSRREVPVTASAVAEPVEEGREIVSDGAALDAQPAERRVIREEMRYCILDLVACLPPVHREVILLGELRDLRDQEIADALGITLEAAKMRLHRARGALRDVLRASCELYRDEDDELACDRKPPPGA